MSEPSLNDLERDVEAARARLASDLATLRKPSTFAAFAEGLKSQALDTKDAVVEKAKASVQTSLQGMVDELKAKAAANPGAVLAIGAGLAWRLIRRPPIATVLVGAGLYSLLRTPQDAPESPYVTRAAETAGRLREQAGELSAAVREQAHEIAATSRERAQEFSESARAAAAEIRERSVAAAGRVSQALGEAREGAAILSDRAAGQADAVRHGAAQMADDAAGAWSEAQHTARQVAYRASRQVADTTQQAAHALDDNRDKVLLGAAALAVAAALGIALQRRAAEPADAE
ncbi:MAG: hypothetical protein M5U07_25705 [Xanthobacteraceae bacterium]|nr:hypothetical protein [Xanthobacteraceae bacterium]